MMSAIPERNIPAFLHRPERCGTHGAPGLQINDAACEEYADTSAVCIPGIPALYITGCSPAQALQPVDSVQWQRFRLMEVINAIPCHLPDRKPALQRYTKIKNGDTRPGGDGIGMEPFGHKRFGFRKTSPETKMKKGIGLSVTRTQAEAMEGSIKAESRPGYGTKFIITFRPE